ncbi:unnamed protein product [Brassicogethes aeneus]|uniref:G-protein coupled receptors family 2 profile 1 domain-containing protein n=1 Tax=Brassicogethes aeneus TaxID=1431903 RepID=A0A9P0B9U0_BRAAE|nr:unnamed protein product [Brassicogethes aeneus]
MDNQEANNTKSTFSHDKENCGKNETTPGYCPEIFDNVMCWPETLAGTISNQSCPYKDIQGNDLEALSYRECMPNATWFMMDDKTWTNYTDCLKKDEKILNFLTFINNLYVIGYSVSLAALVISLWIFITFRTLRCIRIRIHIHLFISFTLNNIAWLIHYKLVTPNTNVTHIENPIWCQALHIVNQYFMLANYLWMFCEGLHLHLALAVVFVREELTMKYFVGIGWGAPFIFVKIYCFYRIYGTKDTDKCWMDESDSKLILTIPVLISLVASLFFLINVLRVILTIMHPNSPNPAPQGIRRAVRAALILIPLFGLHYFLLPFRPVNGDPYQRVYFYISAIIIPYQGFCVSCIFCFANQEVHQAIKSFIGRRIYRDSRWSNYHYTGAGESGGVYVVNGTGQLNNVAMSSLRRKSTTSTRI